MKCPNCGKEIANGSMFCEYCGAQVKKNKKPLFITLFVVIGLFALGGFGYYHYKAKQEIERELALAKQREAEAILKAEEEARLRAEQEAMRKQEDAQNAWKKECYIVDCGEYYLAVQKTPVYKYYNHDDAFTAVRASRVGGFEDWDLPTNAEIELIFDAWGSEFKNGYYWTRSFGFWDDDDDSEYELKSLGLWEKGTSFLIYYYAFNSYKKKIYAVASSRHYKSLLKDSKKYNDRNWFVIVRRFKK